MRTLIFEALECGSKNSEKFVSVIRTIMRVVIRHGVKLEKSGWKLIAGGR